MWQISRQNSKVRGSYKNGKKHRAVAFLLHSVDQSPFSSVSSGVWTMKLSDINSESTVSYVDVKSEWMSAASITCQITWSCSRLSFLHNTENQLNSTAVLAAFHLNMCRCNTKRQFLYEEINIMFNLYTITGNHE